MTVHNVHAHYNGLTPVQSYPRKGFPNRPFYHAQRNRKARMARSNIHEASNEACSYTNSTTKS
jgi:hypothetical protein